MDEARRLLAKGLGTSAIAVLAHPWRMTCPDERQRCAELVARRAAREPFAHIVGEREFYGLSFLVDRRVLVPRPETEGLVDAALAILGDYRGGGRGRPLVIDVGTGSGAIACSVAAHASYADVVGVDTSAEALQVADANRRRLGLSRVRLVRGDLLGWLGGPADLILANLPYIPTCRIGTLMPEVARWEPRRALDGGSDGLALTRRLLDQATGRVKSGGTLLLELDPEQMDPMREAVPGARTAVLRDLADLERVLRIDWP